MSAALLLLGLGCSDYSVYEPPVVPPAEPPGGEQDDFGDAPDWGDCASGYLGLYYNLPAGHADLEPGEGEGALSLESLDWWDDGYLAFERYDPSLDFGASWWPVDEGLAGDPDYFAGRWTAWLRAWSDGEVSLTLGAASDAWVLLDGEVIASITGSPEFAPQTVTVTLDAGQYPLEIRYAHRVAATSGFRFRAVEGDTSICYPEFGDD